MYIPSHDESGAYHIQKLTNDTSRSDVRVSKNYDPTCQGSLGLGAFCTNTYLVFEMYLFYNFVG